MTACSKCCSFRDSHTLPVTSRYVKSFNHWEAVNHITSQQHSLHYIDSMTGFVTGFGQARPSEEICHKTERISDNTGTAKSLMD
jgi:hypothetical protein